jgi:hypothetical protein
MCSNPQNTPTIAPWSEEGNPPGVDVHRHRFLKSAFTQTPFLSYKLFQTKDLRFRRFKATDLLVSEREHPEGTSGQGDL